MLPILRNFDPLARSTQWNHLGRLLDDLWSGDFPSHKIGNVDVYEDDDKLHIDAEFPGFKREEINITLEDNVLTINGYVEPIPPEGYRLAYAEYRVGDYQRAFTLSDRIDQDGIEAVVKDGVLRLHLPKITEAKRHKIAIKAG